MKRKPSILDEIHALRDEFARQHGYDVRRMAKTLLADEKVIRKKVVARSIRVRSVNGIIFRQAV